VDGQQEAAQDAAVPMGNGAAPPAPVPPWWAPAALAWSFLTALPAPRVAAAPATLAAAVGLFPLVGAVLGALIGGLGLVLDLLWPAGPTAAALLAAAALSTGGLHLDGLMDAADGIFGGQSIERRLAIMRDSRVGAFGVAAGSLALLAQYACLSALVGIDRLRALTAAAVVSRWAMVAAAAAFPSARAAGLGAVFRDAVGWGALARATVFAVLIAALAGPLGLAALAVAGALTILIGRLFVRRLGGLTGDTYGALAVIVETAVLYLAAAWHRAG